jgi:hypothetical protein
MEKEFNLSSYNKRTAVIVYFISMFFFLLLVMAFWELLISLFIIIIMVIFTLQWHFFKLITLSNNFILVKSIFKKDIQKKIDLYDSINEFFFKSILIINFKDGDRYYFWGQSPSKIDNLIFKNKRPPG